MTTIRLTPTQKKKLGKVAAILGAARADRVSQGEAVDALAEFALRHRELLLQEASEVPAVSPSDPLFDLDLVFDLGPTDAKTHDRVLYGRG